MEDMIIIIHNIWSLTSTCTLIVCVCVPDEVQSNLILLIMIEPIINTIGLWINIW